MPSPVICLRDATIPNNVFQITDLFPNRSQRNAVIDPVATKVLVIFVNLKQRHL